MSIFENLIIPFLILFILCECLFEKKKAFDIFSEGVNEGLKTVFICEYVKGIRSY